MKCPKCDYLGFETSERCRNCGYEFSLASAESSPTEFDVILDEVRDEPLIPSPDAASKDVRPHLDLDRIIGDTPTDLPLFDDAPLITTPSTPRAPLSVRRTTPEIPRAIVKTPRSAELFEDPPAAITASLSAARQTLPAEPVDVPATAIRRMAAAIIDLALLFVLDGLVLYFTLRLVGLTVVEMLELPAIPLMAYLLLLNCGYLIAFTAVGGQSIGKMAVGIKVVDQNEGSVSVGRATLRTLAYAISALPLGAGFLPGMFGADRLALHDRLAHTRVVRPSI
jgi:uncharacterized RDD family membrane protein YckC